MRFRILVGAVLLATLPGMSWTKSPATWMTQFEKLRPGMTRVDAEKEIERVRKIKSTYELYAMDIAPHVAYKLDQDTVLFVIYKPGIPAARGIGGIGGHPPEDGTLTEFEILRLL